MNPWCKIINEFLKKSDRPEPASHCTRFAPIKSAPRSSESAIQTINTQTRPCKKSTAQAPQPLFRSSFGSRCATSTVQLHLGMLTFRILSPLRNEPKKKLHRAAARAQLGLQEPSAGDHIKRGAPEARRTRIWRRAAANTHKATRTQRPQHRKKLHRAEARAQRRLQEASTDDHIRRGAPEARRTRFWRRAAANTRQATHAQRPQDRKKLHRAEARAQLLLNSHRQNEGQSPARRTRIWRLALHPRRDLPR